MVVSGLNIAGLFHLPASMQRSVLFCLVSMIKLDRDRGEVSNINMLLTDGRLIVFVADVVLLTSCLHTVEVKV